MTSVRVVRQRHWLLGLGVAAWLLIVFGGMNLFWRYKSTPGARASAPLRWPVDTRIVRNQGITLLLFAHPRCACTRASLAELGWLVRRYPEVSAHVLFLEPSGADARWMDTDTYRTAATLPRVERTIDVRGVEAARFGAAVSGTTLLYDAAGRLLFNGGITGARGHEGDNLGRARVAALISGAGTDRSSSPVFGCELDRRPKQL